MRLAALPWWPARRADPLLAEGPAVEPRATGGGAPAGGGRRTRYSAHSPTGWDAQLAAACRTLVVCSAFQEG